MDYNNKCAQIRKRSFDLVINAGKGHLGGSLSCVEILVTLYYGGILRFDPSDINSRTRDKLILSKGHANNSLYVILADLGFFSESELDSYAQDGSFLGGHSDSIVPGIEIISGSLGHGIGVGAGMALGHKLNKEDNKVFIIIGDGECQEGSVWETGLFASHHKLNNLTVFLDRNGLSCEDFTENTAGLGNLEDKWKAFGWDVKVVDGHNIDKIFEALKDSSQRKSDSPLMIIANTVKGKGIYCLENTPQSHHTLPNRDEIGKIRECLKC